MNVYSVCFHVATTWGAAPTLWTTLNLFKPLDPALNGECFDPCVLFLALYLLDLCSLLFSLLQYLYV